jgi:hypothetical protein
MWGTGRGPCPGRGGAGHQYRADARARLGHRLCGPGEATLSKACPTGGTCSPWNTPDQPSGCDLGVGRSVGGAEVGVAGLMMA